MGPSRKSPGAVWGSGFSCEVESDSTPAAGSIDLDWQKDGCRPMDVSMGILIPTGIHEKPFKQIQATSATSVFAQNFVSPWHADAA